MRALLRACAHHVPVTGCCARHALSGLLVTAASRRLVPLDVACVTLGAQVTWNRINYEHRDGTRLKLNVREVTSDTLIASVTQSELEPGLAQGWA